MGRTEYRMVPIRDASGCGSLLTEMFLQFKHVEKVHRLRWKLAIFPIERYETTKETWRFVPEMSPMSACGLYVWPSWCPERLSMLSRTSRFRSSFYGQEWDLRDFVAKWPDIDAYFAKGRAEHKQWVEVDEPAEKLRREREDAVRMLERPKTEYL